MNKKWIIGIVLVAVIALVAFTGFRNASGSGGKQVDARYGKVTAGHVSSSVIANGMVEAVERREVFLDATVRVLDVLVEKNATVSKGQQIAVFDLDALQQEVDRLENNRATQALTLEKLQLLQSPKSTATLEASGTVARNNLAAAETTLAEAQKKLDSTRKLYDAGSVSKSEYEQAQRAVEDAKAALANAKANVASADASLSEARKGNKDNTSSADIDIRIQQLNLEATEASLKKARESLEQAQAAMNAPMDGVLSESTLREGAFAGGMSQAVYAVTDNTRLRVRANVKEYDLRKVAVDQHVAFYGDAFTREEGVKGVITSVGANAFKVQSGTASDNVVEVLMDITEKADVLRPGIGATCLIYTEERDNVPVLPLEALSEDKDGSKYVFVLDGDDRTMRQVFVKLGIFSETVVEVTEGLKAGDLVVLDPQPTYRDGVKVRGTEVSEAIMKGETASAAAQ